MTGNGEVYATIEREIGLLVRRAQSHGRELARSVHPGLDLSAYVLLLRLDDVGEARIGELAHYFGVDKSVTSRQVATLDGLGLVHRTADERDQRAQRVALTEEGALRLHRARAHRREAFEKMFADWREDDVRRLAEDLARVNALY